MTAPARPRVVVVAEAAPMRGGIATFAETITADPRLAADFDVQLLNTARTATRQGGKLVFSNVTHALSDAWKTYKAARKADIMHVQLVADPGLPTIRAAALCLAARAGTRGVIAHCHSAVGNAGRPEVADYSARDRRILRLVGVSSLVLTVSDAGTRTLQQILPKTRVETVDNAVEVSSFELARLDADVPTVLFVGVVCARKGVPELAAAGAALRERGVPFNLVVIGGQGPTPDDEYARVTAALDEAGLADSAVGPEYGEQVRARLRQSDVFVLPSYLEGQPMAILEAMSSGLPVVATAIGAVPTMIRDGVEGRVVEPGDVPALTAALEDVLTSSKRRQAMGAAARKRAEERHDLPILSARLAAAYRSVLTRTRGRGRRSQPSTEDGTFK
ncbi:glycosyltransferase family 4 protein [Cryptosporangium phraense]|uniref:Glycosyltransferase family 4 protein n=1 Tax=Cryptosporangium phraense TaxID=2593070 RepID=A0A545AJ27_9ACTN|nr:glycosyltransferase family 4 protein [Cryptosporangium phraense]TQS41327.1 glycosyltransferase family 4 protein [Cryptosporangium phraense]